MGDELQREQRTRAAGQSTPVDSTVWHSASARTYAACLQQPRKGSSVQVVREFVGYASVWWAQVLYTFLILLSLGLIWVLGLYNIDAKLWRFQKCTLRKANFVSVQVQMFKPALPTNLAAFHLHSAFACSSSMDTGYLCQYMSSTHLAAIS